MWLCLLLCFAAGRKREKQRICGHDFSEREHLQIQIFTHTRCAAQPDRATGQPVRITSSGSFPCQYQIPVSITSCAGLPPVCIFNAAVVSVWAAVGSGWPKLASRRHRRQHLSSVTLPLQQGMLLLQILFRIARRNSSSRTCIKALRASCSCKTNGAQQRNQQPGASSRRHSRLRRARQSLEHEQHGYPVVTVQRCASTRLWPQCVSTFINGHDVLCTMLMHRKPLPVTRCDGIQLPLQLQTQGASACQASYFCCCRAPRTGRGQTTVRRGKSGCCNRAACGMKTNRLR